MDFKKSNLKFLKNISVTRGITRASGTTGVQWTNRDSHSDFTIMILSESMFWQSPSPRTVLLLIQSHHFVQSFPNYILWTVIISLGRNVTWGILKFKACFDFFFKLRIIRPFQRDRHCLAGYCKRHKTDLRRSKQIYH